MASVTSIPPLLIIDRVVVTLASFPDVPSQIARALQDHADRPALADKTTALRYGQLADFISRLQPLMPSDAPVAVFGKPSLVFGAAVTACIVLGRPFVHLDPAMPNDVLRNILDELAIDTVFLAEAPAAGQLPQDCTDIDLAPYMVDLTDTPQSPVIAAKVAADDIIYIVATSGTTGKPKCIPVTQISAALSYAWRDAYTPYGVEDRVGVYIFAIWEMFRPLRNGASVHFAQFNELMNPKDLLRFWQRSSVSEMLFTPSALEKALLALPDAPLPFLSLQRIILNGEVVSDDLIAAVRRKLPDVTLLNLYSICETHDICITDVTARAAQNGPVSVGVPMEHLRAVVLDDTDQPCPIGQPGLLHFEGPDMLGPGYINRPEETALRFRNLTVNGRVTRLYDTGDQGYVDETGAVFVIGRIAHMLKLRGHSIQTRELTDSLQSFVSFQQGVPWIKDISGQGKALVFYYSCDDDQARQNAKLWGLTEAQMRLPAPLSKALRKDLPAYCLPSYLVRLEDIPINAVSGKYDYKRLPEITVQDMNADEGTGLPTVVQAAKVMGCRTDALDTALSFSDQGGDSLMAVTFLLALEKIYSCPVDFDFALNVPLGRLHDLLSDAKNQSVTAQFTRAGILLTGATGFLGSRVLKAAADALPDDQLIYCVIREKRNAAADRLHRIAAAQGVDPHRVVLISAALEDEHFGLDPQSYAQLAECVSSVIHCAAMVNLAVDRTHSQKWAQTGISNILDFCASAEADLRFTSSSAVFPDAGGPFPEAATQLFEGCSGYGAAKIDAEAQIAASGVPSAIVRLPSLYDLTAPNPHDIYEIIMAACATMKALPEGLTFRMVDVHAVAAVLVGLAPPDGGAQYYNYGPDAYVTPAVMPSNFAVLSPQDWLRAAPLSEAERALIASDMLVLRATSQFDHANARTAWAQVMEGDFTTSTNPAALIQARFTSSLPRSL